MAEPTRDYRLKLNRARHHLDWLNEQATKWAADPESQSISLKPNPERPNEEVLVVASVKEPPAGPIAVVIGDFLHNLRSTLDLFAYELAKARPETFTDAIAQSSEFPIFADKAVFLETNKSGVPTRRSGLHKMRGVDPKAQAYIQALQPYRWKPVESHPLWALHELDRINKHRLLHPVVAWSGGVVPDWQGMRDQMERRLRAQQAAGSRASSGTMDGKFTVLPYCVVSDETPIAVMSRSLVPDEGVDVYFRSALEIAIQPPWAEAPPEPIGRILPDCFNFVVHRVLNRLSGFLNVHS